MRGEVRCCCGALRHEPVTLTGDWRRPTHCGRKERGGREKEVGEGPRVRSVVPSLAGAFPFRGFLHIDVATPLLSPLSPSDTSAVVATAVGVSTADAPAVTAGGSLIYTTTPSIQDQPTVQHHSPTAHWMTIQPNTSTLRRPLHTQSLSTATTPTTHPRN
jgi:hypothetical protein